MWVCQQVKLKGVFRKGMGGVLVCLSLTSTPFLCLHPLNPTEGQGSAVHVLPWTNISIWSYFISCSKHVTQTAFCRNLHLLHFVRGGGRGRGCCYCSSWEWNTPNWTGTPILTYYGRCCSPAYMPDRLCQHAQSAQIEVFCLSACVGYNNPSYQASTIFTQHRG